MVLASIHRLGIGVTSILCILIAHSSANAAKFDHTHRLADKVLRKAVVMQGPASKVKYKELKANSKQLDEYIKTIQMITKAEFLKFNKKQQISFLINAYNMYTLKLIIQHYPLESIKDIGSLFSGTWGKKFEWQKLFGEQVTLDNIEHDMIREKKDSIDGKLVKIKFAEPRVHFAVNCASIGCPMLFNRAFTAQNVEKMLVKASALFLSDKSRNYYDPKEKELHLSKIFKWYGSDFVKYSGGVKKFVAMRITKDPKVQKEIMSDAVDIEWTDYNWNLNEKK